MTAREMARFSASDIRHYYDRNTSAFVALGQGGSVGAIHRAVWGPGVTTRESAFHYVEDRIADQTRRLPIDIDAPHLADLGCGVGASLCYLARTLPGITATGVTLSPVQARLARDRIERAGLSGRVTCLEGDFASLPATMRPADLAYAIESFVHAPAPERFFAECATLIRPEGLLVLCDDFLRGVPDASARGIVERFRRGWHINTLMTSEQLLDLARENGFEHRATTDLTHYLELDRPRDRAIGLLMALVGWVPPLYATRLGHLAGGSALQTCLDRRWVAYEIVVFQRVTG